MDRRKAMKTVAGMVAGGGAGFLALTYGIRNEKQPEAEPRKLEYNHPENSWRYVTLDPEVTAQLAYDTYSEGSCMYAVVKSVVAQLAQNYGEPYTSFPIHMLKYGHGGIGGYGTVCGALNGAAALSGLFIVEKNVQDLMINDIFRWYEKESFPVYEPSKPVFDFIPAASVSSSVLCHASNTNWCKATGFQANSNERKERCRRLTADVSKKVATSLNELMTRKYITGTHKEQATGTCLECHGSEGKINNTSVEMSCNPCHSESIGHRIFSDVHYKLMK